MNFKMEKEFKENMIHSGESSILKEPMTKQELKKLTEYSTGISLDEEVRKSGVISPS